MAFVQETEYIQAEAYRPLHVPGNGCRDHSNYCIGHSNVWRVQPPRDNSLLDMDAQRPGDPADLLLAQGLCL